MTPSHRMSIQLAKFTYLFFEEIHKAGKSKIGMINEMKTKWMVCFYLKKIKNQTSIFLVFYGNVK